MKTPLTWKNFRAAQSSEIDFNSSVSLRTPRSLLVWVSSWLIARLSYYEGVRPVADPVCYEWIEFEVARTEKRLKQFRRLLEHKDKVLHTYLVQRALKRLEPRTKPVYEAEDDEYCDQIEADDDQQAFIWAQSWADMYGRPVELREIPMLNTSKVSSKHLWPEGIRIIATVTPTVENTAPPQTGSK
ncbi:MAG: hypothetical protein JO025_23550 [Verrucomicrobia bacterium]|nr:hypothetical protein [Verrucomicrobiota bacterium]